MINHLLNFILPLLIWMSSERKDALKINSADISYIITLLLSSIAPESKAAAAIGTQSVSIVNTVNAAKQHLLFGDTSVSNSNVTYKSMKQLKHFSQAASLLGKNILRCLLLNRITDYCICF